MPKAVAVLLANCRMLGDEQRFAPLPQNPHHRDPEAEVAAGKRRPQRTLRSADWVFVGTTTVIRGGRRPYSSPSMLTLSGITKSYRARTLFTAAALQLNRGDRIGLVGPNGAGKTTLLKLLPDKLTPDHGERGLGHNVLAGYYSQYPVEMLEPGRTVLEEALDTDARVSEQAVRTLPGSFLFSGDSVSKRVEVLIGGEKSRLALVKLLLDPPNLLLMDEPTTHLDMSSIDALVAAMTQFEGTLVFISHDVHFIKTLANKVIHTAGGQLTPYLGDYEFYLHKTKAASARAARSCPANSRPTPNAFPSCRRSGKPRQIS